MAKKQKAIRGKFADEKYLGSEPDLRGDVTNAQIINAYNWYNYFHDSEQAKAWVLDYLREFHKTEKELIKNVSRINSNHLSNTCGWNCRILLLGGSLPEEIIARNKERIESCANRQTVDLDGKGRSVPEGIQPECGDRSDELGEGTSQEDTGKEKRVISIQERVTNRANDLIADLEVCLDNYYRDGTVFKPGDWLSQHDVKPAIAQRIADHYKPLYSEAFDAMSTKDEQLKEGYSHYKKTKLKLYVEFLRSIVSAAETRATVVKTARKPRKKKEKSPTQLVAKLKYKEKDDTFSLQSVRATDIPGCSQLWVFNTKYRTLAVYNAMGPAGLGVKGSTLTGFDEKTSVIKKLRKPVEQLKTLKEGGKVVLRKYMDGIKCKPKIATGRINNECVLVRIIK
jgi:hypothetical protein